MVEITRGVPASGLGSEYNNFLHAPIGADKNGTLLSVLSALARLDLDPWQEAASLAKLPGEAAIQQLTSLIASLPEGSSMPTEPRKIAAHLVALLPRRSLSDIASPKALSNFRTMTKTQAMIYALLVLATLALGAHWFAATRPASELSSTTPTSSSGSVSR